MLLTLVLVTLVILLTFVALIVVKNERSMPKKYYPRFGIGVENYNPLDLSGRKQPKTADNRAPHVIVIGAGWGGLACAMSLRSRGFDVTIVEKNRDIGGRNTPIEVGACKFDVGPTMLQFKHIIEEVFAESGNRLQDHVKLTRLNNYNRIYFDGGIALDLYADDEDMKKELDRVFPGASKGLEKMYEQEKERGPLFISLLERSYTSILDCFTLDWFRAVTKIPLGKGLMDVLGEYFSDKRCCLAFSIHSKYLGMSPWKCPGLYVVIPYFERLTGVWYTEGGLYAIVNAMRNIFVKNNGKIKFSSTVKSIHIENGAAKGAILQDGTLLSSDDVVINADFAYAAHNLIGDKHLKRWTTKKVDSCDYSCSTFMMYISLNKRFDSLKCHHNIILANDVVKNMEQICVSGDQDPRDDNRSIYVCFPGLSDPTVCPADKTGLYILVPTPNLKIAKESSERVYSQLKETIYSMLEDRLGLTNVRNYVEAEKVLTPENFVNDFNVHYGAVFAFAHSMSQVMFNRPSNQFEIKNMFLVGGGAHPGSGVPSIVESARITSRLLCQKYNIEY